MGPRLDHGLPVRGRNALQREAAAFGVLVLVLNILIGSLSHSHSESAHGLALAEHGGKMAICSSGRMVFAREDGVPVTGQSDKPQHQKHECNCCVLMQSSAVLPPPPSAPAPAELTAVQIMRPGATRHSGAAAIPTRRNRGPPSQA
ncbi:MAG: DUF2946 family protein [Rhodomicrobium sp.]